MSFVFKRPSLFLKGDAVRNLQIPMTFISHINTPQLHLEKVFHAVFVVIFLIFLFLNNFFPVENGDIWWHLATGKWIVAHGRIPTEDVFSFTSRPVPWTFMQWLGSTSLYLIYEHLGGLLGLKIFRALFLVFITGIFLLYSYRKIPGGLLLIVAYWMSINLGLRALLRPFIFNFLLIQILLIILFHYRRHRDPRILWVLPMIGVLWSNVHLGSLVYGATLIGLFLLAAAVDYGNRRMHSSAGIPPTFPSDIRIWLLGLGGYLASFIINPYGLRGFFYHFKVFMLPSHIKFYWLDNIIGELRPPSDLLLGWTGLWFLVFVILTLWLIFQSRDQFFYLTLFVVPFFMFLHGKRAIDFFIIVASYIVVACARETDIIGRLNQKFRLTIPINLSLLIILASMGEQTFLILQQQSFQDGRFHRAILADKQVDNPERILAELKRYQVTGPIFCNDHLGGIIIWSGYPAFKPFTDSRQVNLDLFVQYNSVKKFPEKFWPLIEQNYGIHLVLLDSKITVCRRLIDYFVHAPDWQPIILKGSLLVFVKRGAYGLPPTWDQYENQLKNIPVDPQDLKKLSQLLARQPANRRYPLQPVPEYVEPLEEAVTLIDIGFSGAGIKRLLDAAQVISDPILYDVIRATLKIMDTRSASVTAQMPRVTEASLRNAFLLI